MTKKDERVSYYNISDYVKIGYLIENELSVSSHRRSMFYQSNPPNQITFTQFNANLLLLIYNAQHEEYFGYHLLLVEHRKPITADARQDFFPVFAYFYHRQFNILMSTLRPFPDSGRRKAVQIYMMLEVNIHYKK